MAEDHTGTHYAGVVPEALDGLSPKERHRIHKMLRLAVLADPGRPFEVSGAILAGGGEDAGGGPNSGSGCDGAPVLLTSGWRKRLRKGVTIENAC